MTPLVWVNFPLALLLLMAWAGNPLRMTLRHPGTAPDFAAAHANLAAKAALATGGEPETGCRNSLSSAERAGEEPHADTAGDKTIRARLASQQGRLLRSTLTAPHDRPGRAGGAAGQDPGEGVLPAGGPQVAVRGRD